MDFQKVGDFLLSEGLLLTALEFHVELVERGKSVKSLADFFADSANFGKFDRKSGIKSLIFSWGDSLQL